MHPRIALACAVLVVAGGCGAPVADDVAVGVPGLVAATVVRVFDGDSMLVDIEGATTEVRLVGINAPESDECFGGEARQALGALLATGPLMLQRAAGDDDTDQFGRLLRYVYAGDIFVNESLVATGYATALTGSHALSSTFAAVSDSSYDARLGMWAADACGAPRSSSLGIARIEANPSGDDLIGEFVEIENRGTEQVDLSGWIIRDESSVHRFVFPDGSILTGSAALKIWSGCNPPSGLAWCADGPVWNNGGDTVMLQTPEGSVVERLRYWANYAREN